MHRTRIKFCGITRPADAAAAAAAGADAVGMVFYPRSARCVSEAVAAQIIAALPPFVTPVGLFVDASADEVNRVADRLRLTTVQLHGEESPAVVAAVAVPWVVKAVRSAAADLPAVVQRYREVRLAGLLLETAGGAEPGGTGVANDWAGLAAARATGVLDGVRVIAAGGLTPDTVGAVVRAVRPYAVDVSTGIEQAKGIKSAERMAAFVTAVRGADSAGSV